MDERRKTGPELEAHIINIFTKAGWNCVFAKEPSSFDVVLTKGGVEYGYVEAIYMMNGRALKRKVEKIKACLEELKPMLFIVTNGTVFETYFDGVYYATTTIPIEYQAFVKMQEDWGKIEC